MTAQELIAKVLEPIPYGATRELVEEAYKKEAFKLRSAPILARMLKKCMEQRDRYMGDYSLNLFDKIKKTRDDCNAELDRIAEGKE